MTGIVVVCYYSPCRVLQTGSHQSSRTSQPICPAFWGVAKRPLLPYDVPLLKQPPSASLFPKTAREQRPAFLSLKENINTAHTPFSDHHSKITKLAIHFKGIPPSAMKDNMSCAEEGSFFSHTSSLSLLTLVFLILIYSLSILTDDYIVPTVTIFHRYYRLPKELSQIFESTSSSMPLLFLTSLSVFVTRDQTGVGAVVGSSVFSLAFVVGCATIFATVGDPVDWRIILRDAAFSTLGVLTVLGTSDLISPGEITRAESSFLIVLFVLYVIFIFKLNEGYLRLFRNGTNSEESTESSNSTVGNSNTEDNHCPEVGVMVGELEPMETVDITNAVVQADECITDEGMDLPSSASPTASVVNPSVDGNHSIMRLFGTICKLFDWLLFPFALLLRKMFSLTIFDSSVSRRNHLWWITLTQSLLWTGTLSYALLKVANIISCHARISSSLMGLIGLPIGLGMRDVFASVSVARDGRLYMVLRHCFARCVFDILFVLGLPWAIGPWFLPVSAGAFEAVLSPPGLISVRSLLIPSLGSFLLINDGLLVILYAQRGTPSCWVGGTLCLLYIILVGMAFLLHFHNWRKFLHMLLSHPPGRDDYICHLEWDPYSSPTSYNWVRSATRWFSTPLHVYPADESKFVYCSIAPNKAPIHGTITHSPPLDKILVDGPYFPILSLGLDQILVASALPLSTRHEMCSSPSTQCTGKKQNPLCTP